MEHPGPLEQSVADAVESMDLSAADVAAVALAKFYAQTIEAAEDKAKAAYLGPHLLNTLTALGGTPAGRKNLDVVKKELDHVDELKKRRGRKPA